MEQTGWSYRHWDWHTDFFCIVSVDMVARKGLWLDYAIRWLSSSHSLGNLALF